MSKRRLGIVVLFDEETSSELRGIRRALGSPNVERIAPHITIVAPVNVHQRSISAVMGQLRRAAQQCEPFSVDLGAVSTFTPVSPVIYLAVRAPEHTVEQLAAQLSTALQRTADHPFVAHVTLHEAADGELISAAMISLAHYRRTVSVDRIWVLEEQANRYWRPLCDVMLGSVPVRGRGGVAVWIRTSTMMAPDVIATLDPNRMLTYEHDSGGLVHEASIDAEVVGVALSAPSGTGRTLRSVVVVAHRRNEGIGRQLVDAVARSAAERGESPLVVDRQIGAQPHPGWPRLLQSVGFAESNGGWTRRA